VECALHLQLNSLLKKPSPLTGEGWGGGDQQGRRVQLLDPASAIVHPLSLSLSHQGRGNAPDAFFNLLEGGI
jgi:hypothetical protein